MNITTKEAEYKTGLTTYKFRKIVEKLKITPTKKRGEITLRWTEEQVEQISELSKSYFKKSKEASELDIVEYYLNNDSNVHRTSKKFGVNYRAVYRIIKRFERLKCVIVNSKINNYDG